jgi:hypothetical protein
VHIVMELCRGGELLGARLAARHYSERTVWAGAAGGLPACLVFAGLDWRASYLSSPMCVCLMSHHHRSIRKLGLQQLRLLPGKDLDESHSATIKLAETSPGQRRITTLGRALLNLAHGSAGG